LLNVTQWPTGVAFGETK